MYFAVEKKAGLSAADVRAQLIDQVRQFVLQCGESPENADRVALLFEGPNAPCLLRFPDLHVAHVNSSAEQLGMLTDPLGGFLDVAPNGEQRAYRIHLRESAEQHQFVIAIRRAGQIEHGAPTPAAAFWSYNLVILDTDCEELQSTANGRAVPTGRSLASLPLVLALDLNSDGERLDMEFSRRLYLLRRTDPGTNRVVSINRLRHLTGTQNLEGILLWVAQAEEMPIHEARPNRPSRQERFSGGRGPVRAAPTLIGTPYANSNGLVKPSVTMQNPFADEE